MGASRRYKNSEIKRFKYVSFGLALLFGHNWSYKINFDAILVALKSRHLYIFIDI